MGNKNKRIKAQVSLEFSAAFIALLILLVATTKLFVWFGHNIVERHKAYEDSRTVLRKEIPCLNCFPGVEYEKEYELIMPKTDFYDQSKYPLEIFKK
jgi:hypothetical protein